MDEKGKFYHKFRSYEETWKDRRKKKAQQTMKRPKNMVKLFLYNHGLLKMSGTEAIWLMLEVDEEKKKKVLGMGLPRTNVNEEEDKL